MTSKEPALSNPVSPGQVIVVQPTTASSITMRWSFPIPHNPNTGVRIKWGRKPYDMNDKFQKDLPFAPNSTYMISELMPETLYEIFVFGTLGELESSYARREGTTGPAVPVCPTNLIAWPSWPFAYSIKLKWSGPANASSYTIDYGIEPGGTPTRLGSLTTEYTFSELRSNTNYYFEVRSANSAGFSPAVRVVKQTLPVPSIPTDLHAESATDSLQLTWSPALGAIDYVIRYGVEPGGVSKEMMTGALSLKLAGLNKHTLYFVEASSRNGNGESNPIRRTFRTNLLEAPRGLFDFKLTDDSASWVWGPGADYTSDIQYEVFLDDLNLDSVEYNQYVLTHLIEMTEYVFKVRARTAAGYYSDYAKSHFKTRPYPGIRICAPGQLAAVRNSATTAILRWDEPYATCTTCPDAVGYEISGAGTDTFEVTRPPCEIKNLVPQLEYWLTVRAKGGGNNISPASHVLIERRPEKPEALQVTAISGSGATLSWGAAKGDVAVFGYVVFRNGAFVGATSSLEYRLQPLEPGTEYAVEVRARTIALTLSDPAQENFSTIEDNEGVPNSPSNFQFSQNGLVSNLTWDAPTEGAEVIGYRVVLTGPLGIPLSYEATDPILKPLLFPRTRYAVVITARNDRGHSPPLNSEMTTH